MPYSFLKVATDALKELGVQFIVTDQDAYEERKKSIYRGEFGETCPDCEAPIGEPHRESCVFGPKKEPAGSKGSI